MCGIAGACWTRRGRPIDRGTLLRMLASIAHRGPDDQGEYWSAATAEPSVEITAAATQCALGFRRLSIIDLASGHQPLSNEDGTVWIVFNGEVYNYLELRSELKASGHRFSTDSDTETIVHLY